MASSAGRGRSLLGARVRLERLGSSTVGSSRLASRAAEEDSSIIASSAGGGWGGRSLPPPPEPKGLAFLGGMPKDYLEAAAPYASPTLLSRSLSDVVLLPKSGGAPLGRRVPHDPKLVAPSC